MGTVDDFFRKLLRRPKSRKEVEIRVVRPFEGETVYYIRPMYYTAEKEAEFRKYLDSAKAGGLCTGYELTRLPWGELRVFRNPLCQGNDNEEWMIRTTIRNIRKIFQR